VKGILLAFQFFTIIPIQKELPIGRKEVTAMYTALPFIGAIIGLLMYAVSLFMLNLLNTGTLLAAVFITLTSIVLTGGLHLDGWADTNDAYFSYRDRKKRLEILDDPRLGAFGTMGLILIIIVKIALFNEILMQGYGHIIPFIVIPFLVRITLNLYFTTTQAAKETGIAHFFKEKMDVKLVFYISLISGLLVLIGVGLLTSNLILPLIIVGVITVLLLLYRSWSVKHFGGISGDLSGALIEGLEVVLWFIVLAFW